jgi:hypothetical protein
MLFRPGSQWFDEQGQPWIRTSAKQACCNTLVGIVHTVVAKQHERTNEADKNHILRVQPSNKTTTDGLVPTTHPPRWCSPTQHVCDFPYALDDAEHCAPAACAQHRCVYTRVPQYNMCVGTRAQHCVTSIDQSTPPADGWTHPWMACDLFNAAERSCSSTFGPISDGLATLIAWMRAPRGALFTYLKGSSSRHGD